MQIVYLVYKFIYFGKYGKHNVEIFHIHSTVLRNSANVQQSNANIYTIFQNKELL